MEIFQLIILLFITAAVKGAATDETSQQPPAATIKPSTPLPAVPVTQILPPLQSSISSTTTPSRSLIPPPILPTPTIAISPTKHPHLTPADVPHSILPSIGVEDRHSKDRRILSTKATEELSTIAPVPFTIAASGVPLQQVLPEIKTTKQTGDISTTTPVFYTQVTSTVPEEVKGTKLAQEESTAATQSIAASASAVPITQVTAEAVKSRPSLSSVELTETPKHDKSVAALTSTERKDKVTKSSEIQSHPHPTAPLTLASSSENPTPGVSIKVSKANIAASSISTPKSTAPVISKLQTTIESSSLSSIQTSAPELTPSLRSTSNELSETLTTSRSFPLEKVTVSGKSTSEIPEAKTATFDISATPPGVGPESSSISVTTENVLDYSTGSSCYVPQATSDSCLYSSQEWQEANDTDGKSPLVFIKMTLNMSRADFCQSMFADYQKNMSERLSRELKPDISEEQVLVENICDNSTNANQSWDDAASFRVAIKNSNGKHDPKVTELAFVLMRYYRKTVKEIKFKVPELCLYSLDPIDATESRKDYKQNTLSNSGIIAAITISAVAAACLFMLCVLLAIMRSRMLKAPECTPTTLDGLSLASFTSSFRRKKGRHSLRSFLNEAFNDPEELSRPTPLNGLPSVISNKEALEEEFKRLPMNMPRVDEVPPGVEMKNRYANVIPIPETRVHLSKKPGDDTSDYINANFVRGYKGRPRYYIACQAPLPETVEDFWRMIWEYQCKVVLMVTACEENGVQRCASYFPDNTLDCHKLYGDYQVTLQSKDVRQSYTISTLKLHDLEKNLFREIFHFWYTAWPPQGVPEDVSSVVRFLMEARPYMVRNAGPTIVHCSPGTGRTGVILALDTCMSELEDKRRVDVPRTVFKLRQDRGGAVQTKDQYSMIYEALYDYSARIVNRSHRTSVASIA